MEDNTDSLNDNYTCMQLMRAFILPYLIQTEISINFNLHSFSPPNKFPSSFYII